MAFGDRIKRAKVESSTSPHVPDLGSNPTSGHLLILTQGAHNSSGVTFTDPSGWTRIEAYENNSPTAEGAGCWWWKISDGTEQTVSVVLADTGDTNITNYVEFEWDGSTPTVTSNEDLAKINSPTATSCVTGSVTPGETTNICLVVIGNEDRDTEDGGAWDSTWTEFETTYDTSNNRGEVTNMGKIVNASGSQSGTYTHTDAGGSMWGSIACFDIASTANEGSGSPTAATATASGAGVNKNLGSGTPTAVTATSTGAGVNKNLGSGTPQADTATSTGAAVGANKAIGSPTAVTATASGAGFNTNSGSGTPTADTATSTGAGINKNFGSGTPQADTATASGSGTVSGGNITGSGTPQADTATASGAGVNKNLGSGTPQAVTATSTGTGVNKNLGSGTPQAVTATASGAGVNKNLASGSPQAGVATSTGAGVNTDSGFGTVQATVATTTGAGFNTNLGSGTPQAVTATSSGSGTTSGIVLSGIPAGFYSIANCVKDPDFLLEMRNEAQSASVWCKWDLGVDLAQDPVPKRTGNLNLNIALIQTEAEGTTTWARWAPGVQRESTGNLQLNMRLALLANFVLT